MLIVHRTSLRRRLWARSSLCWRRAAIHTAAKDPRLAELGDVIEDEFAVVRERYQTPKHPIVLAHGLLGFDEIHLVGLPGIQYW
jgi:triacylglycerol lipase